MTLAWYSSKTCTFPEAGEWKVHSLCVPWSLPSSFIAFLETWQCTSSFYYTTCGVCVCIHYIFYIYSFSLCVSQKSRLFIPYPTLCSSSRFALNSLSLHPPCGGSASPLHRRRGEIEAQSLVWGSSPGKWPNWGSNTGIQTPHSTASNCLSSGFPPIMTHSSVIVLSLLSATDNS